MAENKIILFRLIFFYFTQDSSGGFRGGGGGAGGPGPLFRPKLTLYII